MHIPLRFAIAIVAFTMLSMQSKFLRTETTPSFRLRYEKNISSTDVRNISKMLDTQYVEYTKKLGTSFGGRADVYLYNSTARLRAESHSRAFEKGEYRSGKLYLYVNNTTGAKIEMQDACARVISRALLDKIPACPQWLAEAYSLYAGHDLERFGQPARLNIASFADLGEDYFHAEERKDVTELYAKLSLTIQFLVNRYGEQNVEAMIQLFNNGRTLEENFEYSFKEKMSDIEKAWVKALHSPAKE
ncbi:MAG: hypothetical protein HYR76_06775 [Ignavibacteria bacterium]|nr:hypothetical protein [Ignavibacteria bacterium]MBI3765719.1 hypothetical protein [Ignavibacteriales bacterium]